MGGVFSLLGIEVFLSFRLAGEGWRFGHYGWYVLIPLGGMVLHKIAEHCGRWCWVRDRGL